jgi:hypothetical protein
VLRAVTEDYLRRSGLDIKLDHGVDNMAMAMSLVASTRGLALMPARPSGPADGVPGEAGCVALDQIPDPPSEPARCRGTDFQAEAAQQAAQAHLHIHLPARRSQSIEQTSKLETSQYAHLRQ